MDRDWTVTDGSAEIPEEILAAAAASQATLSDKLAALRSLSEPFPNTVGLDAGSCRPHGSPADGNTVPQLLSLG